MDYNFLCTGFVIFCVTIFFFRRKSHKFKLPPGPKGYPILGNSLEVDFNSIHLKLEEWANEYGDIYQVNLFGRNMVVLNTGDINREAFLQEPNATNLADRIPGACGKEFFYNFHDIGFSGYSKESIRRRKLGYRLMKAYGEGITVIERSIHVELDAIITFIDQKGNTPVSAEEIVNKFVCGFVITLITGRRYEVESELVSTMCLLDQKIVRLFNPGIDFLLKWFPLIKWIPCQVANDYHKGKWAKDKFVKLLMNEMETHPNDKGVLYALFEAKESEIDKNGQKWITSDDVFGILMDIVTASVVTTKSALLSIIRCLMSWPDVQKKLQKEVDEVIDHKPTLGNRKYMPYTEAVILETLRLISNGPLSIPHAALTDTKLRGYDIPKGTTVISNLWKVHHNENVFKSPYKFDPERFLNSDGELLSYESEPMRNTMPFGIGKRSCIGEVFARGRLFLFVSTIMQNYTIASDDVNPLPPFHPRELLPGIVRIPPEFNCKFEKRVK